MKLILPGLSSAHIDINTRKMLMAPEENSESVIGQFYCGNVTKQSSGAGKV
jgi:hypothetical protein